MKTIYRISLAVMCVGLFLGLAVFGVSASTVSMMTINGSHSTHPVVAPGTQVTVSWRAPAGYTYCNTGVSPNMPAGWGSYTDLPLSGTNYYYPTVAMRFQMQCAVDRNSPMTIEDGVAVDVTTTTCTPNTTQKCVPGSNAVYNFNSCNVQGSLVTQCNANQTCPTGSSVCVNNTTNTGTVTCSTDAQCGTSGYIGGPSCSNGNVFQNYINYTGTCKNPSLTTSYCDSPTSTFQQKTPCSSGTTCSNGACVNSNTNLGGVIVCSNDSQCGTSGYTGGPSCSNGNVFQNYLNYTGTCKNSGLITSYCESPTSNFQQKNVCSSGTTCSNGACTTNGSNGNGTLAISCSANPGNILINQSTTFNGYAAGGSGTYSYTWQGACQAGSQNCSATFSQAGAYTANLTVTSGGQSQSTSCSVGVSGNNNTIINNTCTNNQSLKCVGNSLYWFDSCNVQGNWYQTCGYNQYCSSGACVNNYTNYTNYINTCTYHAYQSCMSGSVHWFDSCGVDQGISQACTGNQTCSGNTCVNQYINNNYGNVYTTTQVRNLSAGNLNWSSSVSASPSDILQFQITIQNNSGVTINNVNVRDNLPTNLFYNNNLTVDGIANSGNITYGVNIGTLSQWQTKTVSYQAQVGPAQNFVFGNTTLTDAVTITSDNGNTASSNASASVNRSGVLGATSVSTGLTNNFWLDSFFLPLILALLGVWAYKAGILNTFGIAQWVGMKKNNKNELLAQSQLHKKITAIKAKENA